jgi:hypothetical protein
MIAIKNMKMPESCGKCRFLKHSINSCWCDMLEKIGLIAFEKYAHGITPFLKMSKEDCYSGRIPDCPLVEVSVCTTKDKGELT